MTSSDGQRTGDSDHGFVEEGLERLGATGRASDAEGTLARAVDALRVAGDAAAGCDVEIYVRSSRRVRLQRERGEDAPCASGGFEIGTAVRVRGADGRHGFAASSGFSEAGVRATTCAAIRTAMPTADDEAAWAEGGDTTRRDLDEAPAPSLDGLARWLHSAWSELEGWRERRRRDAVELVDGWIEVASTVEVLVSADGLRAVRTRGRGRARARTTWRRPPCEPAALELAARDWRQLEEAGWTGLLDDRVRPGEPDGTTVNPNSMFVFSPESSAVLVRTLVMSMHRGQPPSSVGPGWCVRDEPSPDGGEFGGTFDDAGFPAEPVVLADGSGTARELPERGRLRRGSYRDRPALRPWRLIVEPPSVTVPPRAVLVSSCRILPLGARGWCLELDTATLDGGVPSRRHPTTLLMTDPAALLRRCVGGTGSTRSLANGVRTPALVFDGLDPRTRR